MTDKIFPSEFIPLLERDESFRLIVEGVQDYAIFLMSPTGYVLTWIAARNESRDTRQMKS